MKDVTYKQYSKSINIVIDYINEHLGESLDLKTISEFALISEYHFHRIFKAYIGESVGAYITRLRLERVAHLLQTSHQPLSAIAEATAYQSQYSLSKAFKRHFGISPSAFRNSNSYLYPKKHTQKDYSDKLKPKVVQIETKNMLYTRIIAKYGSELDYKTAWNKLYSFTNDNNLIEKDSEYIGLSFDDPNITEESKCRFYACISTKQAIKPYGEFGFYTIKAGRFAVFTHIGSYSGLNEFYQSIYSNWIPDNYEEIRNSITFEKYLNSPDEVEEKDLLTEIYIPIKF